MSERMRPIGPIDLGRFRKPQVPDNQGIAWYLVNALFFQSVWLGLRLPRNLGLQ